MNGTHISIKGLEHAAVLAALYNAAKCQGLGILNFIPGDMTLEEAGHLLEAHHYFDYLHGRILKIALKPGQTDLNVSLYDRDNGAGAARRIIDNLRIPRTQAGTSDTAKAAP